MNQTVMHVGTPFPVRCANVSGRRVSWTPLPLGDDANKPEECLRAALYWAPGLAMQVSKDDWRKYGFYSAIMVHFVKRMKSKGKLLEIPKRLCDLHKTHPGEFNSWATDPHVRVNFLAQQKIREMYSSIVEKIATCLDSNNEHEQIVEVEPSNNKGHPAVTPAINFRADIGIPRFLLKEEINKKEKTLLPRVGLKYDEESDTLTVQLHNCNEEKAYLEVDTKKFSVSRKRPSRKKGKGALVSIALRGARQMLHEQGAKRKSIKLEHLLKRLECHHRRNYKSEVFAGYKVEELCELVKDHQFTWWIPE